MQKRFDNMIESCDKMADVAKQCHQELMAAIKAAIKAAVKEDRLLIAPAAKLGKEEDIECAQSNQETLLAKL